MPRKNRAVKSEARGRSRQASSPSNATGSRGKDKGRGRGRGRGSKGRAKRARVKKEPGSTVTAAAAAAAAGSSPSSAGPQKKPRIGSEPDSESTEPEHPPVDPTTATSAINVFHDERAQGDLLLGNNSAARSNEDCARSNGKVVMSTTLCDMANSDFHLISILAQEVARKKKQLEQCAVVPSGPKKRKTNRKAKLHSRTPDKVHWDFLLAEMKWMSKDFANERRIKRQRVGFSAQISNPTAPLQHVALPRRNIFLPDHQDLQLCHLVVLQCKVLCRLIFI